MVEPDGFTQAKRIRGLDRLTVLKGLSKPKGQSARLTNLVRGARHR